MRRRQIVTPACSRCRRCTAPSVCALPLPNGRRCICMTCMLCASTWQRMRRQRRRTSRWTRTLRSSSRGHLTARGAGSRLARTPALSTTRTAAANPWSCHGGCPPSASPRRCLVRPLLPGTNTAHNLHARPCSHGTPAWPHCPSQVPAARPGPTAELGTTGIVSGRAPCVLRQRTLVTTAEDRLMWARASDHAVLFSIAGPPPNRWALREGMLAGYEAGEPATCT